MENQETKTEKTEPEQKNENNNHSEHHIHEEKHKHNEHELMKKLEECEHKVKNLEEKLSETQKELDDNKIKASQYLNTASYYKTQAETNKKDFERYKERNKDIEVQAKTKANESVAKKILPILDNFDQAMLQVDAEVMKGFSMIYSSLQSILTDIGVVAIDCKDDELDPNIHNCINTEQTDDDAKVNHIATVYQKGYKFAETNEVIRPATVSVYKK